MSSEKWSPTEVIQNQMVLGTAQLGMKYGVANKVGQPSKVAANSILETAYEKGIRFVDTAQDYGESETLIGDFHSRYSQNRFKVISKLSHSVDLADTKQIRDGVLASRERLKVPLHGLLIHNSKALSQWNETTQKTFEALLYEGHIKKLGISIYDESELDLALKLKVFSIIQMPANAFDQRFLHSRLTLRGFIEGREIHIRSVYLQGVLLFDPEKTPLQFTELRPALKDWRALCLKHQVGPHEGAIKYIQARLPQAKIIIGSETKAQLVENMMIFGRKSPSAQFAEEVDKLEVKNQKLLDPRQWGRI